MSDLPAGRELDREIAERVFDGYGESHGLRYKMTLCEYEATGRIENRGGTVSDFCRKCGEPCGYHDGFPHYSTDIAAAWLVVEKMRTRSRFLHLMEHGSVVEGPPLWRCQFIGDDDGPSDCEFADTAPLAICLAALKAVS